MTTNRRLKLYHAARSRSVGARALLEELGADYEVQVLSLMQGEQRQPSYLLVNPMGKVPALRHGDTLITEQAAVYMYAAELYPEAGLSPGLGDPLRGSYLRWMVFYGSCFEPAVVDRSMKRDPAPESTSPYGTFDATFGAVVQQLKAGPWLLGDRFSAADVLWGTALGWTSAFGLLPAEPVISAYVERVKARPAMQRAAALDAALVAGG
jgi:glutathione S-transferase